jgi:hypothetical protein
MGWFQDEVDEEDRGAFTGELTSRPARDQIFKEKSPGKLSSGRNSSMIKGYVKGGSL